MSVVIRRRTARKSHRCEGGCHIAPGDVYLSAVRFPDDINSGTTPWRLAQCARCALRYGRGLELDPIPYDQCAREGLL